MFKQLLDLFKPKNLVPIRYDSYGTSILMAFWFFIVFTVFSGAIRKWVLGSGALGNVVLLVQLVLPLLLYWRVYKNPLPKQEKAPFIWVVYVAYAAFAALSFKNLTLYHGAFGIILHTGFWLVWLAYLQKGQWIQLEKLVPILIVILLIEFVLASLQYTLPSSHILNTYASGEETNASVGDAVRVSGTFSYLGGFQVLVPLFACLAWFMMLREYTMSLVLLVLGMGLLMAFMSGSRGAVGFFVLYTVMAFLLSGNIGGKIFNAVLQGGVIIILVIWLLPSAENLVLKSYDNFIDRVENSDEVDERVKGSFDELFQFRGEYPFFGVGLGATYQGANALFGTSRYVREYGGYESELGRVVLEGGFILLFLRLVLLFVFLKKNQHLPWLAKAFFLVVFLNSMITFNIYNGIFFVLGVILIDRGYYLKQQDELQSEIEENVEV